MDVLGTSSPCGAQGATVRLQKLCTRLRFWGDPLPAQFHLSGRRGGLGIWRADASPLCAKFPHMGRGGLEPRFTWGPDPFATPLGRSSWIPFCIRASRGLVANGRTLDGTLSVRSSYDLWAGWLAALWAERFGSGFHAPGHVVLARVDSPCGLGRFAAEKRAPAGLLKDAKGKLGPK